MKLRFIINPCSGGKQNGSTLSAAIARFIEDHSLVADVVFTQAVGHATLLAREAVTLQCSHVVCVGGDGTLNEVAQALVHTPLVLCLVPNGSGNGLARHLHLPASVAEILPLLLDDRSRIAEVDTGSVNGWLFCNVMGFGFDAEISSLFNRLPSRGIRGYITVALRSFARRRNITCQIESPSRAWSQDAFVVAVANSDQYGYNARIAPGASIEDGRLDLVAVSPVSALTIGPLVARLFLGRIKPSGSVVRVQGTRFRIERSCAGLIHTDGEVHQADAVLEVTVQPKSLRLLLPRSAAALKQSEARID